MGFLDKLTGNQSSTQTETVAQPQKKVLIVEDEKLLGDALEMKFKDAGFMVIRAFNGEEGLNATKTNHPNIILLDLLMPKMDGKQMLNELRKIPEFKMLPVVVLTNAGSVENIHELTIYDDASDFLIKSNVTPEEILQKVISLI